MFTPLDPNRVYSRTARPENREVVYGRLDTCGTMQVTIRIFTSLPAAEMTVRKRGADAIRIVVVGRDYTGTVHPVSKPKRVYRTTGWKKNLQHALKDWQTLIKYKCFTCGSPLTFREAMKKLQCIFCEAERVASLAAQRG